MFILAFHWQYSRMFVVAWYAAFAYERFIKYYWDKITHYINFVKIVALI